MNYSWAKPEYLSDPLWDTTLPQSIYSYANNMVNAEAQDQERLGGSSMDRNIGSNSSMGSRGGLSSPSVGDQNNVLSPASSYVGSQEEEDSYFGSMMGDDQTQTNSPVAEDGSTYSTVPYYQNKSNVLSPDGDHFYQTVPRSTLIGRITKETVAKTEETLARSEEELMKYPLFNIEEFDIEKHGDPGIRWETYYQFFVEKTKAYYKLRPTYRATEKYPAYKKSEKVIFKGKLCSPCGVTGCKSDPFSRHYDLIRHIETVHGRGEVPQFCDYQWCPHKGAFRKDHLCEHYRDFHNEDMLKRLKKAEQVKKPGKVKKPKKPSKPPKTLADAQIHDSWWRCSKCLKRIKVEESKYECEGCELPCELERVRMRQSLDAASKKRKSTA